MTINTNYAMKPITNSDVTTYSTQDSNSGRTVNLVCITGFSLDGTKVKIEPFNFQSDTLLKKSKSIIGSKLIATVQVVQGMYESYVTLQADPSLEKHISKEQVSLVKNDDSETKICDLKAVVYFKPEQYKGAAIIFKNWYTEAYQKFYSAR